MSAKLTSSTDHSETSTFVYHMLDSVDPPGTTPTVSVKHLILDCSGLKLPMAGMALVENSVDNLMRTLFATLPARTVERMIAELERVTANLESPDPIGDLRSGIHSVSTEDTHSSETLCREMKEKLARATKETKHHYNLGVVLYGLMAVPGCAQLQQLADQDDEYTDVAHLTRQILHGMLLSAGACVGMTDRATHGIDTHEVAVRAAAKGAAAFEARLPTAAMANSLMASWREQPQDIRAAHDALQGEWEDRPAYLFRYTSPSASSTPEAKQPAPSVGMAGGDKLTTPESIRTMRAEAPGEVLIDVGAKGEVEETRAPNPASTAVATTVAGTPTPIMIPPSLQNWCVTTSDKIKSACLRDAPVWVISTSMSPAMVSLRVCEMCLWWILRVLIDVADNAANDAMLQRIFLREENGPDMERTDLTSQAENPFADDILPRYTLQTVMFQLFGFGLLTSEMMPKIGLLQIQHGGSAVQRVLLQAWTAAFVAETAVSHPTLLDESRTMVEHSGRTAALNLKLGLAVMFGLMRL